MDSKTLFAIMGHYSVSFTLDTYAHVLDNHKQIGMALMGDLFAEQPITPADITYPVVVTMHADASVEIDSLNFTDVSYTGSSMVEGLQYMKEALHKRALTDGDYALMPPTLPADLAGNQMLLDLSP